MARTTIKVAAAAVAALSLRAGEGVAQSQAAAPGPTTEDIDRALGQILESSTFAPAPGAGYVADGPVSPNSKVLTVPVRYARTGVLLGDLVHNFGPIFNSHPLRDPIALPAGTVVYRTLFDSRLKVGRHIVGGEAWCGQVKDSKGGLAERCVVDSDLGPQIAEVLGGRAQSPYLPGEVSAGPAASPVPKVGEQSAAAQPPLTMEWTFVKWSGKGAQMKRDVRDADGRSAPTQYFEQPREPDGSILLHWGAGVLRLVRGPDGKTAVAETLAPIVPFDEQALRAKLAADLRSGALVLAKPTRRSTTIPAGPNEASRSVQVTLARVNAVPFLYGAKVSIDGKPVGQLANGDYLTTTLTSGVHTYRLDWTFMSGQPNREGEIVVEPGEQAYFQLVGDMASAPHTRLVFMSSLKPMTKQAFDGARLKPKN